MLFSVPVLPGIQYLEQKNVCLLKLYVSKNKGLATFFQCISTKPAKELCYIPHQSFCKCVQFWSKIMFLYPSLFKGQTSNNEGGSTFNNFLNTLCNFPTVFFWNQNYLGFIYTSCGFMLMITWVMATMDMMQYSVCWKSFNETITFWNLATKKYFPDLDKIKKQSKLLLLVIKLKFMGMLPRDHSFITHA